MKECGNAGRKGEGVNEGNGMEGIGEATMCEDRDRVVSETDGGSKHPTTTIDCTPRPMMSSCPSEPCQPSLARQHVLTMNILCLQLTLGPTDGNNDNG